VAAANGHDAGYEGELLTLAEAAEYAGRAPATLRRAMRQQRIPRRYRQGTYGPELVVPRDALDAWLAEAARRVEVQTATVEALPAEGGPVPAMTPALQGALMAVTQALEAQSAHLADTRAQLAEAQRQLEGQSHRVAEAEGHIMALEERLMQLAELVEGRQAETARRRWWARWWRQRG
jgi:Tfp pilus assembly protein FimV